MAARLQLNIKNIKLNAGVIVIYVKEPITTENDLAEFQALVKATGEKILTELTVTLKKPSARYYIGSGFVETIQQAVQTTQAVAVLFNHYLTASQEKNLEKVLNCRVLDREGVILDLFALRARSFEGSLQVELAQLERLSTRLVRSWTHLERQKGGIGLRGPGETQLETDRRLIKKKIKFLQAKLTHLINQRLQNKQYRKKNNIPTLCLVGYTNSGKSTLFNRLAHANVLVKDQLFSTLDPTHRVFNLSGVGKVMLIDTVGFVRNLPHTLIAAFQSTLEETVQADLLLHVIDRSDKFYREKIKIVKEVLTEIGAGTRPQLLIYNKADLIKNINKKNNKNIAISAKTGENIDQLRLAITEKLSGEILYCGLKLSLDNIADKTLRDSLYHHQVVCAEVYNQYNQSYLELKLSAALYRELILK